jgi:hypothetical protein
VTQENFADKGFVAYKVADNVTSHEAYGIGAYAYFRDYDVNQPEGILAPKKPGITFTNSLTVFLNGKGSIKHIIDDQGDIVTTGQMVHYVCDFNNNSVPT